MKNFPLDIEDHNNSMNLVVTDTPIRGKLITARLSVNEMKTHLHDNPDTIKRILSEQLAKGMIELKLIEFTKMFNPTTGSTDYIARCYLAENGDVKILRSVMK